MTAVAEHKPIDIAALHPAGVREKCLALRAADMARYADPATGRLRAELAEHVDCCVCRRNDAEPAFVKEGFRFVRCRRCGLVYVNPRIRTDMIDELYRTGRFDWEFRHLYLPSAEYRQKRFYTERVDYLDRFCGGPGRVLDVGSSTGHFLHVAAQRGWAVHGVEPNAFACRIATEELGLPNIFCGTLDRADLPDAGFDAITAWDVVEHLPDPLPVLRRLRQALRPGGVLFVYVPNVESAEVMLCGPASDVFCADVHLWYFSPSNLRGLFEFAGLEVVHTEVAGIDVDHVIFNCRHATTPRYDTAFLAAHKDTLQTIFNRAGLGNNLRMFARRP